MKKAILYYHCLLQYIPFNRGEREGQSFRGWLYNMSSTGKKEQKDASLYNAKDSKKMIPFKLS